VIVLLFFCLKVKPYNSNIAVANFKNNERGGMPAGGGTCRHFQGRDKGTFKIAINLFSLLVSMTEQSAGLAPNFCATMKMKNVVVRMVCCILYFRNSLVHNVADLELTSYQNVRVLQIFHTSFAHLRNSADLLPPLSGHHQLISDHETSS
jgi:hypothetical protein